MQNLSKNPICFTLILILCLKTNAQTDHDSYMKREHSLVKPYQGAGIAIPFWDFYGSTMVSTNYVRLTADIQSRSGSLWNQVQCMVQNWELIVQFKVHGKGKELFGDGLALWYSKERMIPGPVFGSKDYFSGLAIILDTYSNHNGPHNHQHPYISAMVNNGSLSYDHDRDGTHTQLAGCEAKFRNVDYDTLISIRYENDVLTVSTDIENKNEWKQCFRVEGVKLPTGYYFGASATTGDLSDNHDIYAFRFYETSPTNVQNAVNRMSIIPEAALFEAPRPRTDDVKPGMSNIKIFFILLLGMIVAVAATIFGIMYYQQRKESSRKLW
ncbi:Vesicular integral-membrane protein VIP36 [Pseudolycoriella hygida]|uniref:Vesicular integral-membrane protein VIP36 n=1 Tax=Pseudolycoriella hygida TaxID=35572 RepID=A0A9Q0MVN1_9DIPT|nr:Vesicular integral-membrane protein VIP36 [Pseudolycoriella hygida]